MVYLVADHGGWRAARTLETWLKKTNITVKNVSSNRLMPGDDYPILAVRLARAVQRDPNNLGIAICRTGVGMALVANKCRGIRAVQAWSPAIARQARQDEHSNIIALAADLHTGRELQKIVAAWLKAHGSSKRRVQRRLRELRRIDHAR